MFTKLALTLHLINTGRRGCLSIYLLFTNILNINYFIQLFKIMQHFQSSIYTIHVTHTCYINPCTCGSRHLGQKIWCWLWKYWGLPTLLPLDLTYYTYMAVHSRSFQRINVNWALHQDLYKLYKVSKKDQDIYIFIWAMLKIHQHWHKAGLLKLWAVNIESVHIELWSFSMCK